MTEMDDNTFDLKSQQYTNIVKKLPVRFDTVTTLCEVAKAGRKIIKVDLIFSSGQLVANLYVQGFPKCIVL